MAGECPTCMGCRRLIGFGGIYQDCYTCVSPKKTSESTITSAENFSNQFESIKKVGRPKKVNHDN
jgi:hypothetical protein